MCLNLTSEEFDIIRENFIGKLLSLGYPAYMRDRYWVDVSQIKFSYLFCRITFEYFMMKYEVQVDDIDGILYMTEITYSLEETLKKNDKGTILKKETPYTREMILDYLKSYTPEESYYDYINKLHEHLDDMIIGE